MPIRVHRTELSTRELVLHDEYNDAMTMGMSARARNTARLILRHFLYRAREGTGTPADPQVIASVRIWQERAGGPMTALRLGQDRGIEPINPIPANMQKFPWDDKIELAQRESICRVSGHTMRWYAFPNGIPVGDPPLITNRCVHCGKKFHAYTHERA